MSTFVLDPKSFLHIAYWSARSQFRGSPTPSDVLKVAQRARKLWTTNEAAYRQNYPQDRFAPEMPDFDSLTRVSLASIGLDYVQVIKSIRCFLYQICELPLPEREEAWNICEQARSAADRCIPGFDEKNWG